MTCRRRELSGYPDDMFADNRAYVKVPNGVDLFNEQKECPGGISSRGDHYIYCSLYWKHASAFLANWVKACLWLITLPEVHNAFRDPRDMRWSTLCRCKPISDSRHSPQDSHSIRCRRDAQFANENNLLKFFRGPHPARPRLFSALASDG
ncbi:unnamed protein product [Leptosia nina]|uniref:Uncharacterized protein n=1 Tax=Leptosia nina TaxID=320188 RepID=A0AAV1J1J5_9NEOP